MLEFLLTFGIGVLASIVSGMAGGGGGLISAPFFILIGMPPQVAVATTKFGSLGLTLGSVAKFRNTGHIRKEYMVFLSLVSVIAAILGSRILLSSSNEYVEQIVGAAMLITIPFLFLKDLGLRNTKPSYWKEVLGYIFYFTILVLQAAFGAGIGMMLMVVMMGLLGFTALESSATRRIPGLILAVVSLGIYVFSGVVHYGHGLAMLAGMVLGGYIGTHIAVAKGSKFVKIAFAIAVVALGLRLVFSNP